MPFIATWMNPEIILLSEVSQKEKDKYHMISLIRRIQKMIQINLFTKQKQTYRLRKQTCGYQRGKVGGERNWEFGIDIYTLLYIKQIINKDLLYSTGDSTEYSAITYMGKESEKEQIYVYIQLNHFAVHLKLTQQINYNIK